jgi:hypothetical protein
LGDANLALIGTIIPNLRQVQIKEGPSTLDKDGLGIIPVLEVSMPSMAPPKVIKSSHALMKAHPLEGVKTI